MSEQELWMNQRDRDRLKVLHEVEKGHLTQRQAGERLKLSERWVGKLVGRLRKEGEGGILHRLRGRARAMKTTRRDRQLWARLGGLARAAKHTKEELSRWAKMGGRPPNKSKAMK